MLRNVRLQMLMVLAVGAVLGYLAATGRLNPFDRADAAAPPQEVAAKPAEPVNYAQPSCCCDGVNKGQTLALLQTHNQTVAANAAQAGKKPNILIIWGDDIGYWNPSCYHREIRLPSSPQ